MSTKSYKNSAVIIAAIMAAAVTALFLVANRTELFITGYVFALIGIGLFLCGNLIMISNGRSYPWFAAFPSAIWTYLILQIILSALFIILESLTDFVLPTVWLILLHILLLAGFSIFLFVLKGARGMIEARGDQVKTAVVSLQFMREDVESALRKFPAYTAELRQVSDALRYSDPMIHPSLAVYDERIRQGIAALFDNEPAIPALCSDLLTQIADRNSRAKVMK